MYIRPASLTNQYNVIHIETCANTHVGTSDIITLFWVSYAVVRRTTVHATQYHLFAQIRLSCMHYGGRPPFLVI